MGIETYGPERSWISRRSSSNECCRLELCPLAVLESAAAGRKNLLDACREILEYRSLLEEVGCDLEMVTAVASELDDVPGPSEISTWAQQAAQRKLEKRDHYLATVQTDLLEAFSQVERCVRAKLKSLTPRSS